MLWRGSVFVSIVLVFLIVFISCNLVGSPWPMARDSAVVNAALEYLQVGPGPYVVESRATDNDHYFETGERPIEMSSQMYVQFRARNLRRPDVRSLILSVRTVFVEPEEIKAIFKHGFWAAFYKRFPLAKGVIRVTLPGYDVLGTHALCYVSRTSGGLNGAGELLLLERKGSRWAVVKSVFGWVS